MMRRLLFKKSIRMWFRIYHSFSTRGQR
jgi:hypothetical protein